jgi:hypothetical protein
VKNEIAQKVRDGARALTDALRDGSAVRVEVGFDVDRGSFCLRGEASGRQFDFPIDEATAQEALAWCARPVLGASRQSLSNVAVDVALPGGKRDREINGYPGVALFVR